MRSFHISLRRHATVPLTAASATSDRLSIHEPFAISFEVACAALSALPRMFVEPDGSFVWALPPVGAMNSQLDGVVNDRDGCVVFIEIKGQCLADDLIRLAKCFCDRPELAAVDLIQEGRTLSFVDFAQEYCRR